MKKLGIQNLFADNSTLVGLTLLILILAGCQQKIEHASLDEMVAEAKSHVDAISVDNFKNILDSDKEILIIDCRQYADFVEGHIPGAKNVPRGKIGFSPELTNRRAEVYIYGYDDGCSALAADVLRKLKFKKVRMIGNGWNGFHKAYPEVVEEGGSGPVKKAKPVEESGGCG